jgi:3-hydroxyisobutyrate dehydrogenase-like beta-hydroxyacid dehydrogenase
MKIGLIGLGKMGRAMAARFAEQGFDVIGWDHDPAVRASIEGARFERAHSAAAVAAAVDTVVSIVTEDNGVRHLYLGANGLLSGPATGTLFIEMSTLQPGTVRALAADVAAHGGALIDAPVLGSIPTVHEGKLLALAGGTAADVARARTVLMAVCRDVIAMGPIGAGSAMKLAVNLVMAGYLQSLAEALSLGVSQGLDLGPMLEIMKQTPTANPWLMSKLPVLLGGEVQTTLDIRTLRKDVMSAVATGAAGGVPMPVTAGALSALSAAVAAGWGGKDLAQMPEFFREAMLQRYDYA